MENPLEITGKYRKYIGKSTQHVGCSGEKSVHVGFSSTPCLINGIHRDMT